MNIVWMVRTGSLDPYERDVAHVGIYASREGAERAAAEAVGWPAAPRQRSENATTVENPREDLGFGEWATASREEVQP